MLNLKTRNLLTLTFIIKTNAIFSAQPIPTAIETLSVEKIGAVTALGFSAGLALGNGNLRNSLLITGYTRLMINRFTDDRVDQKTCVSLFGTYAMLGIVSSVLYNASTAKISSKALH